MNVYGTPLDVSLDEVRFEDVATRVVSVADRWQPPVRDASDGSVLLVDRRGAFSPGSKRFSAHLQVGSGPGSVVYLISGLLEYEYREERARRFLSALMSV